MGLLENARDGVARYARSLWRNPSHMAESIEVPQSVVSKFLAGSQLPRADNLMKMLEACGARVVFPDEGALPRAVSFGETFEGKPGIHAGDYRAVPMIPPKEKLLKAGGALGEEEFFVIHVGEEATRYRERLAAFRVPKDSHAMAPRIPAGAVVLVDLAERTPGKPDALFLVQSPKGAKMVRRVRVVEFAGVGSTLLFYAEDPNHAPEVHALEEFRGDMSAAILGRVIKASCTL